MKPIARRPSSPDAAALASSSAALAAARIACARVEQHLPRGQQLDAARRAPQQGRPDVGLQAADELRERRLGHVQPRRGAAEVQLLPDGDERVQLPDLHVTEIMQFRVSNRRSIGPTGANDRRTLPGTSPVRLLRRERWLWTTSAGTVTPMTGAEYLESIRDGREIWAYGERVEDVTTHPAFRNADADGRAHVRRAPRPRAQGRPHHADRHRRRHVHASVLPHRALGGGLRRRPRRDRRVGPHQLRLDGPRPDYKAAFLGTLGANADFYDPYQDNAKRWYKAGAGALPVLQPRDHQPADRSRQGRRRGPRRLHPRRARDGRGRWSSAARRSSRPARR